MSTSANLQAEEWRPIPGFEGLYDASNLGNIRGKERAIYYKSRWGTMCERIIPAKLKKPSRTRTSEGYVCWTVALCKEGVSTSGAVSKWVALAFLSPRPSPLHVIAHWDGDPSNNRLSNLRYALPRENAADRLRHGRTCRGEEHHFAKLSEAQVIAIRMLDGVLTQREIAAHFGLTQTYVSAIMTGKKWGYINEGATPSSNRSGHAPAKQPAQREKETGIKITNREWEDSYCYFYN